MSGFLEGNDEQFDSGYLAEPVARPVRAPVARAPKPKRTPSPPPGLDAAPAAPPAQRAPAIPKAPGTWAQMTKRPEYAAMSPEDRQLAREGYYDNYVAPNIPEPERAVSRELFLERSKTMDPKEKGFFGKVWDKLGEARHSIRQAAGTLPEQVEQARLEKKHGVGLMSKYVDRPDLMPKHVLAEIQASPEVKRTLMANWNAATPEQRLQLEQARGPMGEAARALNAKHPDALPKKKVPDYLGLGKVKPVITPDTSLLDSMDPRWEARQRNLISQGMDAKIAEGVARHDAYRDTTPGAPIAKIEKTDFDFETYKRYNKSPFFKNPLVRGAVKGANGYAQGIAGLNLFVAEAVGADDTAAGLARSSKNMHNFAESMGTPTDHIQRNFEGAVQSIGMQLPAMIGGAVTGSEGMVLGSMFLQTFGTEYADGRRRGQEQPDAIKRAALYGSFEVIGERFGLRKQLELMRQASRGVGTDVLAKWMAVTLKKEVPGEMLTTTGQFMTDKIEGGIGLNTEAGLEQYLHQMGDTVTQTIMQGGLMSTGTTAINKAMNYRGDRAEAAAIDRADGAREEALDKWATDGLTTPAARRVAKPDAHAAGLTPAQQDVDARAREAFADLTAPAALYEDEIPASLLLGQEEKEQAVPPAPLPAAPQFDPNNFNLSTADFTQEYSSTGAHIVTQTPPAAEIAKTVPEVAPVAVIAPTATLDAPVGKKTKLTPFEHPDLGDVEVRGELAYLADQAGWAQEGGKMIRKDGLDRSSEVTGRTPWIPKQLWYQMMPERLNEEDTIEAVGKALTGQPMAAKEKRVIANMLDFAKASLEEQNRWKEDAYAETGAENPDQYNEAAQVADAIESLDDDIAFDLNDPRAVSGANMTDEDIDAIFGTKNSSRPAETADAGTSGSGNQGTGAPTTAEPGTFDLQGETPAEVKAKEKQTEKTKAAERKAKQEADAKEKAEQEKKDIKQRAAAAADNFKLGEDAEVALSGQKDIFAAPPAAKKDDFDAMFDDIVAEDAPKTEKQAKAKKAKKSTAPKAETPKADDFDAMFDDIIGEGAQSAEKAPHELTQAAHRIAADRGKAGKFKFSNINLDNETAESLLKNHRAEIPHLGVLMGAKGGKSMSKMAADIMRVWKLRGELSTATVESLMTLKAPDLKELVKRIGAYAGVPKKQLAESIIAWRDKQRTHAADRLQDAKHARAVFEAVKNGETVAMDVLADYPELVTDKYPRESEAYKAAITRMADLAVHKVVGMDEPKISEAHRAHAANAKGKEAEILADIADAVDSRAARAAGSAARAKEIREQRTAGEAAVSAAKNTAAGAIVGISAAVDVLGELFGTTPAKLGIMPVEESKYARAAEAFDAAVAHFGQAAVDIKDVMRAVIKMVTDKFGRETTINMKPYVVRYITEYSEGKRNAAPTSTDSEQDRQDDEPETLGSDDAVHGGPAGAGAADPGASGKAGKERAGPSPDLVVHDAGTTAGGTSGAVGVSGQVGEFRADRDVAEPGDAAGSSRDRTTGTAPTGPDTNANVADDAGPRDVVATRTFEQKVQAQRAVNALPVVLGNKADIDKTLPLLLEGQREDVLFAEKRLMQPTGYGVLFANGTGTGKTYLSLGVVKRQIATGKTNGIVLVPNDAVMKEWLASAPNLGVELHILKDKTDMGKGVSITTYANFGDNSYLLDRAHDFVVADEAHNLMASKDANVTKALETVRALTMHPSSASRRTDMLHRDLNDEIRALRLQTSALADEAGLSPSPAQGIAMKKLADKLEPLEKAYRKALDAQREIIKNVKPEGRPRLLAVSATPFAWEPNIQWAHGYLFDYPKVQETGAYNAPNPYQKFMIQNFGYRMRTGKLNEPDAKVDRSLMQVQFNMRLRKEGVLSTRMLDVDRDYDRKFVLVDGGIGARIDAALKWLRESNDGKYATFYEEADKQFDYLTKSRLLEAIKAKAAVDIIKSHHALGRKVVVFHDFNQGGGFAPFDFGGDGESIVKAQVGKYSDRREVEFKRQEFFDAFRAEFPDLMNDDLAKLKSPIETFRDAFPNALFNNGKEKKRDAESSIAKFNDDAHPEANLIVVQSAINAGWSGHDKTGNHMRVLINVGMAAAPVVNIQKEGRIYRTGQQSDAAMRYLNTGTMFERIAFANSIATRSETAENLAMGEFARGLKKSFIAAFEASDVYPAGVDDGKGGKEADRREATMNDFAKAKSYYFGQEKKNTRNKAAEGADYFATPEPLGLKMVEWLGAKPGESLMEPSGGHGAIARWFPEDTNNRVIEPSLELASRLGLVVADPSGIITDTFESHNTINKYDGIAMNPPFGTAGKLAMEHVAKAFGHLREGGRIVAIIPAGPSMDKRLNDWLTATLPNDKLANQDAKFVTYIGLPSSTFARAGTGVSTRVVIIDRIKGGNDGTGAAGNFATKAQRHDYDINQLFDYIEDYDVDARPVVAEREAPTMPAPRQAAGVTQHAHGRVLEDANKAAFRLVGDKLETDAPVVKVTTAKGKELEGVYVPDLAMAKAVDAFTWKPAGKPGYFVRIKHVVRPQGPAMFSKATVTGDVVSGTVTKIDADEIIGRLINNVGGRVPGVTFNVVDTFKSLPAKVQRDAIADGSDGNDIDGAYLNGVVYVVIDRHQSKQALEETIFHELYGHAGLHKLFGDALIPRMARLYHEIGEAKGLVAITEKYNFNLYGYAVTAKANENYTTEMKRRVLAEEMLTHIVEKRGQMSKEQARTWLKKEIVGAWRAVLRSFGYKKVAQYNDDDLAFLLARARFALRSKAELRPTKENQTLFARGAATPSPAQAGQPSPSPVVNLRPVVSAKLGLLDTPMRLAFQKTGALAVWRGAFRLLEKTAGAALNNRMGEVIKAGMIDRYGLSDAVIERHEEMRVKMIAGVRTSDRFLDRLKGLSRPEYAVLYAAANNADTVAVDAMIASLPEDSQAALREIKELVRDLGQEAVDLKMLDFDTFKANEMAYLHRSYLKHEADLTEGEKANRATRIKGDQFKQRGLADVVSSEKLLKWLPEFWGTRVKDGAVTNGIVGTQFLRFERRDDPSATANLPGITGTKPLGRLKEVVYWPAGEDTPDKFKDWTVEGEWTARRTAGKDIVFRRDFSLEERRRMGEIEDIRYAMAKTLNIAIHDVEVGKYFAWLAEGYAKLPGELPAGAEVIEDARKAEATLQTFAPGSWVKVPETKVAGTGVSAYGKLAGRYVEGPVWADIRAVNDKPFFTSAVGKAYEKLLQLWKISKTALSPAVHVNNVMANVVMADWHDVGGKHLLQAAHAWAGQGRNAASKRLVEDFQDNGGELGTYALNELQRDQLAPILDELLGLTREANELNGLLNASTAISLLREGMVRQAAATLGQSKTGRVVGAIPSKMIDIYQMEDQIFRLAAFIKARESGLTDREAGRFARKSFLDYDIQAPWVVAAKRSGLLPFVSFSYRAIPKLYQTVRDKPWKIMKLAMVLGGLSAVSAAFLGLDADDEDDERRWLPEEKRGKIWGMVPKMIRMPWNTPSDNPVFLDVRRFMPAGDITDTGMSHAAVPLPGYLSVGGPIALLVEFQSNKSQFTGKEITKDTDTKAEATAKLMDWAYKWVAPNIPLPSLGTVVPGIEDSQLQTYAWTGIVKAYKREEGTFGRDQSVPMAVGSAFGVKLEGYDPAFGQKSAVGKLKATESELRKERAAAGRQRMQGGLDDEEFQRKMERIREKQKKAAEDFGKRATEKSPGHI